MTNENKKMAEIANRIIEKNNYNAQQIKHQFPLLSRLGIVKTANK